jgi:hypothetical protein
MRSEMMMPLRFWMAHDTAEIMALMSDFLPPGKRLAWASDAWAAWSRKTERAVGCSSPKTEHTIGANTARAAREAEIRCDR